MIAHLLNCSEVAETLHVSRSYAYLLMRRGDVACVHIGTAVRVRPEDLDRYIRDRSLLAKRALTRLDIKLRKLET